MVRRNGFAANEAGLRPTLLPMKKTPGIMSSDMVPVFYERSRVKVKRFS